MNSSNFFEFQFDVVSPIFLGIILSSLLILLILNLRDIIRQLKEIKKNTCFVIFLIFLLGFSIRAFYMPHRFIADDLAYIKTAESISKTGKAQICSYSDYDSLTCSPMDKIFVYPFLLGLIFYLFGISIDAAFSLNILLGSLSIFLIFLLSYFLFNKNEKIGIYAALLFSLFPFFIRNSVTAETESSSVFFILFALFCFLLYFRTNSFRMQLLALISLTFAIWTRFENIMLLPLFVFLCLILEPNFKHRIKDFKFWIPWILVLILTIPHIYSAILFHKASGYAPFETHLSTQYLKENYWFLDFLAKGKFYPFWMNLIILLGFGIALRRHTKEAIFLFLFFICFTLIYLSYFVMGDKHYVTPSIVLILLAAYGVGFIERFINLKLLSKKFKEKFTKVITLMSFIIIFLIILSYYPYLVKYKKVISYQKYLDHLEINVISNLEKNLKSQDCYLIMENTLFSAGTKIKPIFTDLILENEKTAENILNKTSSCLFYFEDQYCNGWYPVGIPCGIENSTYERCKEEKIRIMNKCKEMHEKFNLESYLKYEFDAAEEIQKMYEQDMKSINFSLYKILRRME